jgi:hypothetical protein
LSIPRLADRQEHTQKQRSDHFSIHGPCSPRRLDQPYRRGRPDSRPSRNERSLIRHVTTVESRFATDCATASESAQIRVVRSAVGPMVGNVQTG